jgi:hypothetical protein
MSVVHHTVEDAVSDGTTPITPVTRTSVSGSAVLFLNPSLQMKLTDDYAAGNTDAHKSPVNERYRLLTSLILTK